MKKILFAFALVIAFGAMSCTSGSTGSETVLTDSTAVKTDSTVVTDSTKTVDSTKVADTTKK